jgi:hypothetical protein
MEEIPEATITTHDKKDGQEILNMRGSVMEKLPVIIFSITILQNFFW